MNSSLRGALLDTHAAIWFFDGTLDPAVAERLILAGGTGGLYVSPVSAWEIGLLARPRGERPPRMTFEPSPERWFEKLLAMPIVREAPFTASIAISSSSLPGSLHDDPADRLLIATARELNVPFVTRDQRILDYGAANHVQVIAC